MSSLFAWKLADLFCDKSFLRWRRWIPFEDPANGVRGNFARQGSSSPELADNVFSATTIRHRLNLPKMVLVAMECGTECNIMLPLAAFPKKLLILPPGAIQWFIRAFGE